MRKADKIMYNRNLKISGKKIYVLCTGGFKTGGTELMHQLVYYLKMMKKDASIVYVGDNLNINSAFSLYIDNFLDIDDVEDDNDNIFIVPETMIYYTRRFINIKKVIWWLSVDNFTKIEGVLSYIGTYGVIHGISAAFKAACEHHLRQMNYVRKCKYHLCQSYYAVNYLSKIGIPTEQIGYLSDYINDVYLTESYDYNSNNRSDIVLYNPKKGYEITKKLMELNSSLTWKPLINMSNEEMRHTMITSKIYVDFGNHPGKDRIPREAAIAGCCVITGRRGSASFSEDVSVPEEYKFDDYDIRNIDNNAILDAINDCFENYDKNISKYSKYRKKIILEKEKFINDIKSIFED